MAITCKRCGKQYRHRQRSRNHLTRNPVVITFFDERVTTSFNYEVSQDEDFCAIRIKLLRGHLIVGRPRLERWKGGLVISDHDTPRRLGLKKDPRVQYFAQH
ncbi:hypothetical protein AAVH_05769 [Aphelenchoides avenae]|nr:hypothetical protein AAVH_05769 [Aphelenchus avenae]